MHRRVLFASVLILPFVVVGALSQLSMASLAGWLLRPVRVVSAAAAEGQNPGSEPSAAGDGESQVADPSEQPQTEEPQSDATSAASLPEKHARASRSRGLYVRKDTVLRAIQAGLVPAGQPVEATHDHPGGVVITSAGGLMGVLRVGDVVTHVGGRAVRSAEDIIAAVVGAHRSRARHVSGRIWRSGQPWSITVEAPW